MSGIVDVSAAGCGSGSPCIDPIFGPTQAINYWSATSDSSVPTFAWDVDFGYGFVGSDDEALNFYVRAVRGGL